MTINSFTQGILAGGAAAYLHGKVQKEAAQNKAGTWMSMALQVNHLVLLSAENVVLSGSSLGALGTVVRAASLLAPASLLVTSMSINEKHIEKFNAFYRCGVIANSLATLALGHPVFATASLSMLAIDAIAQGKAQEVFEQVKKVTAVAAFLGYGAQILSSESAFAFIGQVSALIVSGKYVSDLLPEAPQNLAPSYATHTQKMREYKPKYWKDSHSLSQPRPKTDVSYLKTVGTLCRKSAW